MDELFGYANHIATLVWEKGRKNDARLFSVGHEYMLVFAKSLELLKAQGTVWREPKPGASELWDAYQKLRAEIGEDNDAVEEALRKWHRELPDKHPSKKLGRWLRVDEHGPWRDRDISWIGGGGPRYEVTHPVTGKPCKVPDRGWGFATPESMQHQVELGLVEFRKDHSEPPMLKRHLRPQVEELHEDEDAEEEEADDELAVQVMPSVIYKQAQSAVKYLRKLIGEKNFDNPKDYRVLARLIRYCSGPDAVILDSFAGSGSTGQAVLDANRQDGGQRRFIMIQQAYDSNADKEERRNICRTSTRPRVVAANKQEEYAARFSYLHIGDPLFGEYRDFGKKMPKFVDLAKYIFYTETSREIDLKKVNEKTGFIGSTPAAGGDGVLSPVHAQRKGRPRAVHHDAQGDSPDGESQEASDLLRENLDSSGRASQVRAGERPRHPADARAVQLEVEMRYGITFSEAAIRDMRKLAPAVEKRVTGKIARLADNLSGDVKRLRNFAPRYRLRVGDWRVLFDIEGRLGRDPLREPPRRGVSMKGCARC